MMGLVQFSRYELESATTLNSVSGRKAHEGALIRAGRGIGCIHPWPELGDAPLSEQLRILSDGGTTPLIESALRCAEADGTAREQGRSLFEEPVPESHWLALPGDEPSQVREEGFDVVKLKIGRDLFSEVDELKRWHDEGFQLRIDGNESLSLATFLEFWEALGVLCERVEIVEDPVRWDPDTWRILRETGVPVACDRDVESRWVAGSIAVIKPAVTGWLPPLGEKVLVTSYMDHAIGMCWAAVEAARLARGGGLHLVGCGLLTHRCFQPDAFFERIQCDGPRLLPVEGTGLGFDDLLEGLPWERLN